MKTYGTIKFSTVDAPKPISGICESFSYKPANQIYEIQDEAGIIAAMVEHGKKGAVTFSSTPPGTVTALGVRAGAELTITGFADGKIIVTTSGAKWSRGAAMVMDAQATHYPDITAAAVGTLTPATIVLARGSDLAIQLPTDKVWWGMEGITPFVAGIVQSCSISESVQVQEEEGSEEDVGKIVAVSLFGYKATGQMEVLTAGTIPELGTSLEAFGTFRITSAEEKWSKGQTRSIMVDGVIAPS